MSEVIEAGPAPEVPDAPAPADGPATRDDGPGTWRVTWSGLRTVAVLELRQRVRSTRWVATLVVWALLLAGMTALFHAAFRRVDATSGEQGDTSVGAVIFGLIVYLVLSLGSLIAPALSATSINGDRTAGVLATLQTTLLTPAEIALGKLAASWITALALLAVALPFVGVGYLEGGTPLGRLVVTITLLAVMLLVVCAIGLGWSAVTARTTSSAVLTYLTVAFVGVGLPVLFLLFIPLVQTEEKRTVRDMVPVATAVAPPVAPDGSTPEPAQTCQTSVQTTTVIHSERTWWLLAANPYVILADASPKPAGTDADDVLSVIRSGVRELRLGPEEIEDRCVWYGPDSDSAAREAARRAQRDALGATWPYGLGANLALAAAFTVVAIRRLRTPTRVLPRGTRVA